MARRRRRGPAPRPHQALGVAPRIGAHGRSRRRRRPRPARIRLAGRGLVAGRGARAAERRQRELPPRRRLPSRPAAGIAFAAGDVDADGVADLVLGDNRGTIAVHRGRGDGSFAAPRLLASGGCAEDDCPWLSAVADLNGDGAADIVLDWTVLFGAGDGTATRPVSGGGNGQFLDLDGDAIPDRLLADPSDEAFLALPAPATAPSDHCSRSPAAWPCGALAVADVNGDSAPDVVGGCAGGGTRRHVGRRGPADGDAQPRRRRLHHPQPLPAPFRPDAVAVADLDGDGARRDLLAAGPCRAADASCRANGAGVLALWRGARTASPGAAR
ncbi:MAG: VCBS repeat-containing protein [Candidatus Binatia bacterium]